MKKSSRNLIGQGFGRLTVIEEGAYKTSKNGQKFKTWLCKCSCKEKTEKENIKNKLNKLILGNKK